MDLLIALTYVVFAWAISKIFCIPANQWTLATAALGGMFAVAGLILLMNHNHPYIFTVQEAVISISVTPQVTRIVSEVTDKNNQLIEKGDVLSKFDPVRYQARVDRLQADLVTATYNIDNLKAQLSEAVINTTRASAERDRLYKNYQRCSKGSQAKVNPFSESDIDNARQNYLAQDMLIKGSAVEQTQIQSQLDSMVNGEQSRVASLRAQLTEVKYSPEQMVVRVLSNGYATQILVRPGIYIAALLLRPVVVFIPEQKRQTVAQFCRNSLLRLKPGDEAEVVSNVLSGQALTGKLTSTLPVAPGGSYQAQGALQSLTVVPGTDGVLAVIELDLNTDVDALSDSTYAQVAVYSGHFAYMSAVCKVPLCMTNWIHYLYSDH